MGIVADCRYFCRAMQDELKTPRTPPAGKEILHHVLDEIAPYHTRLVAVSKTKPAAAIRELYEAGQRIFGENYVQELVEKSTVLPADIEWHFIGHLQTNKVKYIAPFVHTIHSVDSLKLLKEIEKQAAKNKRIIHCLLQVHIAKEETKFGMDEEETVALMEEIIVHPEQYHHVRIAGLMGMATHTSDEATLQKEFEALHGLFEELHDQYAAHPQEFKELSMGMSADYKIALKAGSTLVRIGSLLFGKRD